MSAISTIKLYYCRFPLKIIYKLSFGNIRNFDTLLIETEDTNGIKGYGEATFLPGYGSEDPKESFHKSVEIGSKILNHDAKNALDVLRSYKEQNPFLITAFVTSIEHFSKQFSFREVKLPIIGLVNVANANIKEEVESLISGGYQIVKVKVGIDSLKDDLEKIGLIDKYADGNLKIRVDANQSLETKSVEEIVKDFSPFNLQLLEQPFKKNNFQKHMELKEKAEFPIMLDESIWGFDDIKLVSEKYLPDFVKLKLQKCGGFSQFKSMINYLKEKKIGVIIGNGVQTDLNCIIEGEAYKQCNLSEAAENIGFLKLYTPITRNEIKVENGHMSFYDEPIEVNSELIDSHTIIKKTIS